MFFTQSLSHLVANAKLDRPLDSHAPQTESMYHYDDDDWGDQHENGYDNPWDTEEEYEQIGESYSAETYDEEEHYENHDQDEDFDEDDQDNYE